MEEFFSNRNSQYNQATHCGTAACIAGWAITLAETKTKKPANGAKFYHESESTAHELGIRALDLTHKQADKLFYTQNWPRKFNVAYREAPSSKAAAQAVRDRIYHFMKTGH